MTNAYQIDGWAGPVGRSWAEASEQLDRQIEPIGRAALELAAPALGERVLDVGCGAGATTVELAAAVGPSGAVLGVDVAPMLLEIARRRATGLGNVSCIEADAQVHAFEPASFDLVFSRFGVMFFEDPVAAFANLRGASRPGGRLVFVCWRQPSENPLFSVPLAAAASLFPDRPTPPPLAPGPFAFADDRRIRGILSDAGWTGIRITPLDVEIGGGDLDQSVSLLTRVGPLGGALREVGSPADLMVRAGALLRSGFQPYQGRRGVMIPSATWIVSARA